jgi:phage pi2 protein 07
MLCFSNDVGQWEVGQVELRREEFDILTVVRFLSWGLKDLLEQKQITFNMTIDDMATMVQVKEHLEVARGPMRVWMWL